ncbi:hypothetical protein BJ875DRAFT_537768 [Amylocarpus encephaloides]|uniref:DUF8021 domain-containing protein n=1 Tax=Amylocarpus encephaloides TaxID=45428 RepID=A0A9P7Y9N9_9HELO|nr:hypothetical protein BJ875DRAFT_537768 [Amylocarpus encephaloides]
MPINETNILSRGSVYSAVPQLWLKSSYSAPHILSGADCTREGLLSAANSYIAAQTAGKLDGLTFAANNFTYRENNKVIDIKKGVISQSLKIDLHRSTADTIACASYTMLISTTGLKPYVLSTQLRYIGNDTASLTMIDTIAATTGSLFFNAAQTLKYIQAESWATITDVSKRSSRETLKMAGDAYLDMWTDAQAADKIPWGTDCERVEGSRLTKPCGGQLPHGGSAKPNGMRRYVIDETVGSVDVLCSFDSLGGMPDSHEIRMEEGKVKYVHTVTK